MPESLTAVVDPPAADPDLWNLEAATEAAASFFLAGWLAEARRPTPAAGRVSMATMLVDALLAAPGVVVPERIAALLSDAITAALAIAAAPRSI